MSEASKALPPSPPGSPWNPTLCRALMDQLWTLRADLLASEQRFGPALAERVERFARLGHAASKD